MEFIKTVNIAQLLLFLFITQQKKAILLQGSTVGASIQKVSAGSIAFFSGAAFFRGRIGQRAQKRGGNKKGGQRGELDIRIGRRNKESHRRHADDPDEARMSYFS